VVLVLKDSLVGVEYLDHLVHCAPGLEGLPDLVVGLEDVGAQAHQVLDPHLCLVEDNVLAELWTVAIVLRILLLITDNVAERDVEPEGGGHGLVVRGAVHPYHLLA